jgi:multiple sugar transport system permease protein
MARCAHPGRQRKGRKRMIASSVKRRRTLRELTYKDAFWVLIFLGPNLIGFLVFTLWPVIMTFYLSLNAYDILTPMKFIGLENYRSLLQDPVFIRVFKNTWIYTLTTVPIGVVLSLFLAIALDKSGKGIRFFRGAFFIPVISSMVSIGVVWQWMYNPEFGLINNLLARIGIRGPMWLTSDKTAMLSLIIVAVWKNLGYNMLLFLAGLQNIDRNYYEAAEIDGAGWWQQFRNITVPLLAPTTFFVLVMAFIGSFQVFDLVMMMTQGGPGRATSVVVHYLYQNAFKFFKMGYASAMAYVLFAVIMVVTGVQMLFQKKWVGY